MSHSPFRLLIAIGGVLVLSLHAQAKPTVSVGTPQNGALLYPKTLAASKYLNVRHKRNYGTETLIQVIESAMRHVHRNHPETPKLYVGDLSDHDGGHLGKHVSHQSGRDADLSYFRDGPLHDETRLIRTTPEMLDLYRTWTLMAFLLDHPQVQMVLSDKALIKALHAHAKRIGHSESELKRWFGPKVGAVYSGSKLRHTDGHATHFHLRVRGGQEHKKWSEVTHQLDHKVLAKLKRNALKPSDRPPMSVQSAAAVSRTATVNRTSRSRLTRKRPRSLAAVRARASAQRARLRAKLRAAQARAKRRIESGRTPPQDPETATTDREADSTSPGTQSPADDRLSQGQIRVSNERS